MEREQITVQVSIRQTVRMERGRGKLSHRLLMSEKSLLKFSRERPPLGLLQTEERQKPSGSICKHVRTVKKKSLKAAQTLTSSQQKRTNINVTDVEIMQRGGQRPGQMISVIRLSVNQKSRSGCSGLETC